MIVHKLKLKQHYFDKYSKKSMNYNVFIQSSINTLALCKLTILVWFSFLVFERISYDTKIHHDMGVLHFFKLHGNIVLIVHFFALRICVIYRINAFLEGIAICIESGIFLLVITLESGTKNHLNIKKLKKFTKLIEI